MFAHDRELQQLDFRMRIDYYKPTESDTAKSGATMQPDGMAQLRLIYQILYRLADLGVYLQPDQRPLFNSMVSGQCLNMFGSDLAFRVDEIAAEFALDDFSQLMIGEMPRRRGKSFTIGIANGIMMIALYKYNVMIMNLDDKVAQQGVRYALTMVQLLVNDPESRFDCKIEGSNANELRVRSVWGTVNQLLSLPNIERTHGTVRFSLSLLFLLCACEGYVLFFIILKNVWAGSAAEAWSKT